MADDGGLARLQRRLAAIPREVKKAVEPALMKEAGIIADTMGQLAPDDPSTNAPDLKSSIAVTGPGKQTPAYSQPGGSMTVAENAVAVTVGDTDVRYPHLQEYGTKNHPAQPFFWPAVRMRRKRSTNAIKNAIRRAVRKNWGGS
jgi:HK97 gp10 family phage protein